MTLEEVCALLKKVLPNKVFYGTNSYDNEDNAKMPFIVYQEVNKRPPLMADDKPVFYESNIQITLVTKKKSPSLERTLEKTLLDNEITYSLLSEFFNSDKSVNRVYEIKMEDI